MTQPQTSIVERSEILVADDSAVFRKLVQQTLTEDRYALVFAKSGHEAIQLFESHSPSVVIVDWVMPDLTGKRVEELRQAAVSHRVTFKEQILDSVTFSVGIAAYPENGSAAEELLHSADSCLYESKGRGRNCVTVATSYHS